MHRQVIRANCLLFLAALIWGSAFVAQKMGMDTIGPFWYTGLRFTLGCLLILPLLWRESSLSNNTRPISGRDQLKGVGIGLILFSGINLQQVALLYASVTNTGFITGLYVVLVPVIGLFLGHRYGLGVWVGVVLAVVGMYLLSVKSGLNVNFGDLLTLTSTFFWAFHVIALSGFGHALPPVRLAVTQFATCAVLSLLIAVWREPISLHAIREAGIPLLYGGLLSVGVGFTIQVIAQRHARAAHSAIILSLEAVVAAITGWLVLNETLDARALLGCALMLAGTLLAQLTPAPRNNSLKEAQNNA